MQRDRPIVVVGSINMDMVLRATSIPRAGETLLGSSFATHAGGKGANQAVGVARLGYAVRMIGGVGRDEFGRRLLAGMAAQGVDTEHVGLSDATTGVALIVVDDAGENSIVVVPGANRSVTPELVTSKAELLRSAGLVLAQLEVPLESVLCAAQICAEAGVPFVLDPAPAQPLPEELLRDCAWITPNESEAQLLTGGATSPEGQVAALRAAGAQGVILKRGADGVVYTSEAGELCSTCAPKVEVRDTTAAGDAFNAAFAVGWMRGYSLDESVRYAVAASAFSVTREGAQSSLATESEVQATLTLLP
jgi:ribokinase